MGVLLVAISLRGLENAEEECENVARVVIGDIEVVAVIVFVEVSVVCRGMGFGDL